MFVRVTPTLLLCLSMLLVFFIDLLPLSDTYANRRLILIWSIALSLPLLLFYRLTESVFGVRSAPTPEVIGATIFIVSCIVSGAITQFGAFGLTELFFTGSYLISAAMLGRWMAYTKESIGNPQSIALALSGSLMAYGLMSVPVYCFAVADNFNKLGAVIPWGFVNIRYWSHLATWCIPLLPLAVLAGPLAKQRLWRLGVALGAAIWWWLLFLTSSRGSMVGLLIGAIAITVLFGRQAIPWLRISARYLAFGALTWLILSVAIPSLVFDELHIRQLNIDSSSGRMPLWEEAWAMSLQNFPWGMGPQSWLTHEIITPAYENSPKFGHPHNMYLMWAAEYGWLAVGGLLLIGIGALRKFWQRRGELRDAPVSKSLPLIAYTASVVAALTHAGVSAVFIAPASMIVGLFVLSAFWAEVSTNKTLEQEQMVKQTCPLWLRLSLSGGLLVLCLVWVQSVYDYYDAMNADEKYYQEVLKEGAKPRFWFHGDFPRRPDRMPASPD